MTYQCGEDKAVGAGQIIQSTYAKANRKGAEPEIQKLSLINKSKNPAMGHIGLTTELFKSRIKKTRKA